MALEIVTDGKNDKTEKNYWEYLHNMRTRDGHVSCSVSRFLSYKQILYG